YDRYHRRIGMAETARKITENIREKDSLSWAILEAYAKGVNAYISTLKEKDLPVEYKLLGYSPEPWEPYKSILMLMNMRLTLSGGTHDLRMTKVLASYGEEVVRDLFPSYPSLESPIVPAGTEWPADIPL